MDNAKQRLKKNNPTYFKEMDASSKKARFKVSNESLRQAWHRRLDLQQAEWSTQIVFVYYTEKTH